MASASEVQRDTIRYNKLRKIKRLVYQDAFKATYLHESIMLDVSSTEQYTRCGERTGFIIPVLLDLRVMRGCVINIFIWSIGRVFIALWIL